MSNKRYTYRIKSIAMNILFWELVFWMFIGGLFYILGYFSSTPGEKVAFKSPEALWLLLLILPFAYFYIHNLSKTNQIFESTGKAVRQFMFQPVSSFYGFFRFFLFRNAFVFLVLALAQPVFGSKKVAGTVESLELAICLDVSNSMNAKDIDDESSRLTIAKRALTQLINNLHGEKIGICVFANNAFTQLPITNDYYAAKMYINDIETSMLSNQGTNIKGALENALSMFSEDEKTSKAILLITDGENHEENPDEVLSKIKEDEIQLIVLGLGTTKGGLIPKNPNRPELGYKSTPTGTTVLSKLNPEFLSSIAKKAGGYSTISSDPFPNLNGLLKRINRLKKTPMKGMEFDVKENRYAVPLFISILFWLLYYSWTPQLLNKFKTKKA